MVWVLKKGKSSFQKISFVWFWFIRCIFVVVAIEWNVNFFGRKSGFFSFDEKMSNFLQGIDFVLVWFRRIETSWKLLTGFCFSYRKYRPLCKVALCLCFCWKDLGTFMFEMLCLCFGVNVWGCTEKCIYVFVFVYKN